MGEFEVHRLIGEGGFGIVYLCHDQALDRYVALKEYMPASLATRQNDTLAIVVKSKNLRETFEAGLKSFINEARLLARFDHPSLLKVYRFWQANGTAYMSMPYYEGPTLKQALAAASGPPDEALLRSWLLPMLDALEEIHRVNCYHRDISPDNILLTRAGPLLLDFGAARRVIGDMTQALTVVLKPGFAPIEQYGDAATMSQGAWTDLYALASVVYFAITGRPPMSAVDRVMDDRLEPLSHRVAGRYSPALLAAVDAALSLRPQDRPQSVALFRAMLNASADEQTADLHLWGDDDATVPGALTDAPHHEPHAVSTVPRANESLSPTADVALPVNNKPLNPAAAMGSGAGLAPLSAAGEQKGQRVISASLPQRAPLAERTAMPSLLPSPSMAQTPPPTAKKEQPERTQPPVASKQMVVNWALRLCVGAFVLAAAAAIWTFTRSDAEAVSGVPQAPARVTPNTAPAPPATAVAPAPSAAPPVASTTRASERQAEPVAVQSLAPAPVVPAAPATATAKAVDPLATEKKTAAALKPAPPQNNPRPRPSENGETNPVSTRPSDTPPIRLGNPSTPRAGADSPLVLPKPSATPVEAEPVPAPVTATPNAGLRSIARCANIRQRAGLEDLTDEELQFLRTQCR
jgi:serine/threonine protein kinase